VVDFHQLRALRDLQGGREGAVLHRGEPPQRHRTGHHFLLCFVVLLYNLPVRVVVYYEKGCTIRGGNRTVRPTWYSLLGGFCLGKGFPAASFASFSLCTRVTIAGIAFRRACDLPLVS
jgi:hypothetical protein